MAELKTWACPKCGAQVALDRGRKGTCRYCGTTVFADPTRDVGKKRVVASSKRGWWIAGGSFVLVVFSVVFPFLLAPPATKAPPPLHVIKHVDMFTQPPTPVKPPPVPAKVAKIRVATFDNARLIDSDGDKVDELLLPVERTLDGQTSMHFGVFATHDGALRHLTPALDGTNVLTAALYGRLVVAQRNGQLTAYDLASGATQWSSTLGEAVFALCAAPKETTDTLQIVTGDDRNLTVDVKTGRQTPAKRKCKFGSAYAIAQRDPSDRRDERAPPDVDAFRCGSVRVFGSQSFVVPDACMTLFHVNTDRLDGMVGHAMWRVGSDFLVFGVRRPGTYVPTVGRLSRGTWRWKNEVPLQNPLEAETGGPRFVNLHGDQLVVGYEHHKPRAQWVTCFDVRDGTRRWNVELPARAGIVSLAQNDATVVVQGSGAAWMLAPDTGQTVATIGVTE